MSAELFSYEEAFPSQPEQSQSGTFSYEEAFPTPASDTQVVTPLPDVPPTPRQRAYDWIASVTGAPNYEQVRKAANDAEATAILAGRSGAAAPEPDITPQQIEDARRIIASGGFETTPGGAVMGAGKHSVAAAKNLLRRAALAQIQAVQLAGNQAWEQSRQSIGGVSQMPQMFAENMFRSATGGIVSPVIPTTPHSPQADIAGGLGDLTGFVAVPAKAAAGVIGATPAAKFLAPAAGDTFAASLAKNIASQSATLGLASAMKESGSAALDSTSAGEAASRVGQAALGGLEMGAEFGLAGSLLPKNNLAQWAGRAAAVSAAQDAIHGATPWDDRPLHEKVFDYGANIFFTRHGDGRISPAARPDMTLRPQPDAVKAEGQALKDVRDASPETPKPQEPKAEDRAPERDSEPDRESGKAAVPGNFDYGQYTRYRRALEAGGKPNPNSSALGPDQFIAGTWERLVAKYEPALSEYLSREELLALRTDPAISTEMVAHLDRENAAALRTEGVPVSNETLYAAHHFGASKSAQFYRAAADTPTESIFSKKVLDANPYLKGKTKAQVLDNWRTRAGQAGADAPAGDLADARAAPEAPRGPGAQEVRGEARGAGPDADLGSEATAPEARDDPLLAQARDEWAAPGDEAGAPTPDAAQAGQPQADAVSRETAPAADSKFPAERQNPQQNIPKIIPEAAPASSPVQAALGRIADGERVRDVLAGLPDEQARMAANAMGRDFANTAKAQNIAQRMAQLPGEKLAERARGAMENVAQKSAAKLSEHQQPSAPAANAPEHVGAPPARPASAVDGHLGQDSVALADGGQPFATREQAAQAKRLQPAMRVVRVDGGWALADKTPAQLAAQAKAAKRLAVARTGKADQPIAAHEFIAGEGGLARAVSHDLGVEGNPRIGNRWLYAGAGKGMTLERATEKLHQAGYIGEHDQNAALEVIRGSLSHPRYTPEGWQQLAEAEGKTRFEDHLAARQEEMGDQELAREQALEDHTDALGDEIAAEHVSDEYGALEKADIPWDEPESNTSREDAMRALGFTEQEIQDDIAKRSSQTQKDSGIRGRADGDGTRASESLRTPPADRNGPSDSASPDARQAGDAELTSYSESDLRQREQQRQTDEALQQRQLKDDEQRAQADAGRASFTLTGSDRPFDAAAARGQTALFSRRRVQGLPGDLGKRTIEPVSLSLQGWDGTRSQLRELATGWYSRELQGRSVHNDDMNVDVHFTSEGKNTAFATSGNLRDGWRSEMVRALPDLVKRAVKVGDSMPDKRRQNDTKAFHTLVAPLNVGDRLLSAKITLREALQDFPGKHHKFYDIAALEIDDGPGLSGAATSGNSADPLHPTGSRPSHISVQHLVSAINSADVRFSFAGRQAQTADQHALSKARQMIAVGEDPADVLKKTGWHQGADGAWRFEISDDDAEPTDKFGLLLGGFSKSARTYGYSLPNVLHHPKLFAAYPELKNYRVYVKNLSGRARAAINLDDQKIFIDKENRIGVAFSDLLHEIQHGIQNIEGFATGGDAGNIAIVQNAARSSIPELRANVREAQRVYADAVDMGYPDNTAAERKAALDKATAELAANEKLANAGDPYDQYRRLAGEVEARNTQTRQLMADAERRGTHPNDTADVQAPDVIVTFNGKDAASAPPPANARDTDVGRGGGLPPEAVQAHADAIRAKWKNAPQIEVVKNLDDPRIPPAVRAEEARQRSQGASGDVEGFFHDGKVYLLADHLQSAADVARVVLHESIGHYGLHGVFGEKLGAVLDQLAWQRRGELAAKAREYGLVPDHVAKDALPGKVYDAMDKTSRRLAAEEMLAELAVKQPQLGFVRRAVAAIRSWLRENLPGFGKLALSDDEIIRDVLLPARRFVQEGRVSNATLDGDSIFSRAPNTKARYEARIDELYAGGKPSLQGVRILDRSDMLGMLGISDGPVHLVESKVEQGRFNHALTAKDWKKVPEWLDNPAAVFDSDTKAGRLVFVAPELVRGSPVRMIVDPRSDGQGVNLLINAYDAEKNPFVRWERDGLLRYFDRQKAAPVTGSFQPQLAGLPGKQGHGKILTEKNLTGWRNANAKPVESSADAGVSGVGENTLPKDPGVRFKRIETEEVSSPRAPGESHEAWQRRLMKEGQRAMRSAVRQEAIAQRDIGRGLLRAMWAKRERMMERAQSAFRDATRYFDKNGEKANLEAIDQYETGGAKAVTDPTARLFFAAMDGGFEQHVRRIQELDPDAMQHLIEHYFPHLWEDPTKAAAWYQGVMAKRPLRGDRSFLKQRTHATIKEGMATGLKPISANPVDHVLGKIAQMDKFITFLEMRNDLKERGWLKQMRAGERVPAGFARVEDPAFQIAGGLQGYFAVPEMIARDINNYLSPSLYRFAGFKAFRVVQNLMMSARLGWSAFHAGFTTLDNLVTHFDVGARRLLDGDVDGGLKTLAGSLMTPFTSPYEGGRLNKMWMGKLKADPGTAAILDALEQGGARMRMHASEWNNGLAQMRRAIDQGSKSGMARNILPAVGELSSWVIHQKLVPAQKMSARVLLMKYALDSVAGKLGHQRGDYAGILSDMHPDALRQIATRVVDTVDNRLGQMTYDNQFWNKTARELAQVAIGAVGWQVGTLRTVTGALRDIKNIGMHTPEKLLAPLDKAGKLTGEELPRTANLSYFLSLALTIGGLGAVTQYLLTGKGPEELKDYVFPKTGRKNPDGSDERISFPTYLMDHYKLGAHPIQTVSHKIHPVFSVFLDTLTNKDFYGNKVRDEDAPWAKQAAQVGKYLAEGFLPYSAKNYMEMDKTGTGAAVKAASFFGIAKAPASVSRTDFQAFVAEHGHSGSAMTPDQAENSQARRDAIVAMRRGEAADLSGFAPAQQRRMRAEAQKDPTVVRFDRLSLTDKLRAWDRATDDERQRYKLKALILRSNAHSFANLPVNDKDAVRAKVNEVRRWGGPTVLAESD
ncbi:MAG: hypothetical protein LBI48_00765 [Burkholderiaceae bacterium]|jgi:protein-tyrosine-phosphatase|nr:hypothetical protein [Burkholderiaceae bacterium]